MNTSPHEHALALGPCEDFEFDLVEFVDGGLAPDRLVVLRQHLTHCPRCRAYESALRTLDAGFAGAIEQPRLSADFDERLAARIGELQRSPARAAALAAAEEEHRRLLQALGREFNWRTVLNAVAVGSVAGSIVFALNGVAPHLLQSVGVLPAGVSASLAWSTILGIAAVAGGFFYSRTLPGAALVSRRG